MPDLTINQQKIVDHDKENILISASAGSGKTHTMIARVINLIANDKASVDQILAVTFTEKAAADMKEKLKDALVKKYEQTHDERIIAQLNQVATSDICTIDSFCARLVRTYFFKAGVSPDFKIADTADSSQIITSSVDKTLREFYNSGDKSFVELMDLHSNKRSDKSFRELLVDAFEFCRNEPDFDEFTEKYKKFFTVNGISDFSREYKERINRKLSAQILQLKKCSEYFSGTDLLKCKAFCDGVIDDINDMVSLPDAYALEKYFKYNRLLDVEKNLNEEQTKYKERAVKLRDKVKAVLKGVSSNLAPREIEQERVADYYAHVELFVKILKRFSQVFAEEKKEENLLDFGDLEHFALQILKDEEVKKEVRERYKYVFIDEYQDVNTVQEQILSMVSNDNLLMVGDLKQGIYAFRGCRSEIFADKLKTMPAKGQTVVRLNENFRSAKKVVDTVNEIFNFCMTDDYFEENYKGNSELVFGGLFSDGYEGRANLHYLVKPETKKESELPRIYDVLKEIENPAKDENENAVALVIDIINDELSKTIYDVKKKVERPVRYGDIAILARAKNNDYTKILVKGLVARGIPVVADAKENVCDYPEILTLVNAVRLVDCFEQDIPLASTLKSHIGGFSEEDLFDMVSYYRDQKEYGSFFDAYSYYLKNAQTELKDRLKEFDEYFKKIRFLADFKGAQGVIKTLVKDKDLESYLLTEPSGKTKLLRLKRFISATCDGGRKLTVKEFLNKVESSADAFGLFECGDENAVRVMTMHASKGLEFPVVIVCGLERKFDARDDRKEILFNRKYGFVPRYYDREKRTKEKTLFRAAVISEQAEERMKEEMRLFYVATTRATYSLHLVFSDSEDTRVNEFVSANSFYEFIPSSIPAKVYDAEDVEFTNLKGKRRKVLVGEYCAETVEKLQDRFSYVYPFISDVSLPLKSDVTSASKNFGEEFYDTKVLFPEEQTDTERGNIAHKILERIDFSMTKSLAEQVQDMVNEGVLLSEEIEKVNLSRIEKAVLDADMKNVCAGGKRYSEKGFLTEIEGSMIFPDCKSNEKVVLQGIIDLLVIDGDCAKIIDYKYSKLSTDGLKKRYSKQLELYSYAVEKVLKKRVCVKKIVNLFTGEVVDIT